MRRFLNLFANKRQSPVIIFVFNSPCDILLNNPLHSGIETVQGAGGLAFDRCHRRNTF